MDSETLIKILVDLVKNTNDLTTNSIATTNKILGELRAWRRMIFIVIVLSIFFYTLTILSLID